MKGRVRYIQEREEERSKGGWRYMSRTMDNNLTLGENLHRTSVNKSAFLSHLPPSIQAVPIYLGGTGVT